MNGRSSYFLRKKYIASRFAQYQQLQISVYISVGKWTSLQQQLIKLLVRLLVGLLVIIIIIFRLLGIIIHFQQSEIEKRKYFKKYFCLTVNPLYTSRLFLCYILNKSIRHFRDGRVYFVAFILFLVKFLLASCGV